MKPFLDIVIPMAGRGSRFATAGFKLPKPLIDVGGQPMIRRVIENLKPSFPHRFIFLVLAEHLKVHGLESQLRDWAGPNAICVPVNEVTEGAACTVLLARRYLTSESDMLIANSDQLVDAKTEDYVGRARQNKIDGSILVFEDSDPKWSFARVDSAGFVKEVAEKKPISNLATVGIYYFRSGQDFVLSADQMIAKNIRTNGEFYVCPVYNELIGMDRRIDTWKIAKSAMHGLGTPEDLKIYLQERQR